MALVTKEEIWTACEASCPPESFEIPEWDGKAILLRFLTPAEAQEISKAAKQEDPKLAAQIAVRAISDAQGRRVLANADTQAVMDRFKNKPLARIMRRVMEMNALSADEKVVAAIKAELEEEDSDGNPTV